jgi:signal transduction histidine kinase
MNATRHTSSRAALIVEDDAAIREAIADVLRSDGYEASSCVHGREALEYLRRAPHPDVIVLDLMMPVMDGWQFRVEQRKDPNLATIPVIALSADGTPKAAAVDADAYLKKPVSAATLLNTVDRVVLLRENRNLQAQLVEAQRLTSLGTLAAGVAHEINNPLSYLMLNIAFVTERLTGLLDDRKGEGDGSPEAPTRNGDLRNRLFFALEHARDGAERIRAIVRGLKMFSRPEDESNAPVDVRGVLESAILMLQHEIDQRARLVKDYRDVPWVDANEGRLGQVFLNLLLNATQSLSETTQNEIRAVIRHDPPYVLVEVHDTGGGIPAEARGRIFEPFFTTKPVGIGTGLGLPICHGIVKSLGGSLTFESEVGRGSVFRVALPAAAPRGPPPHP